MTHALAEELSTRLSGAGLARPRAATLLSRLRRTLFSRLPREIRDPLIRRQLRLDPGELQGVTISVAQTVGEYLEAARLLHTMYVDRGLIDAHPSGLHASRHLLLPSTTLFIAKRDGRIIGTLSLAVDSEHGLPMDEVYPAELARLRAEGRTLAEVGTLCIARGFRRKGVSFLLNKAMWRCASELLGVTDLLAGVAPEAACVYEAILRFVSMEPRPRYAGVKVPGVGLRLDLLTARAVMRAAFSHLPADDRNPYHVYAERSHPQIQLPTAAQLASVAARVKPALTAQLARLQAGSAASAHPALQLHLQARGSR